jgi:hypothetical protein
VQLRKRKLVICDWQNKRAGLPDIGNIQPF